MREEDEEKDCVNQVIKLNRRLLWRRRRKRKFLWRKKTRKRQRIWLQAKQPKSEIIWRANNQTIKWNDNYKSLAKFVEGTIIQQCHATTDGINPIKHNKPPTNTIINEGTNNNLYHYQFLSKEIFDL